MRSHPASNALVSVGESTVSSILSAAARSRRAAPFLPMSRAEMDVLGWDQCDVILVTGDAYIDHPSFGMALVGRLLEAHGFRVGILSQPDWHSAEPFRALGRPRLYFGITAGNMDSLVNRYTSDRKIRSDDAYTPNAEAGKRPDRAVTVYAQRAERLGRVPVGLAEDADPKAVRLQQPPDQRHAEARVVDVGVAVDENDVAFVPAERVHLLARHGQERRGTAARDGTVDNAGGR